MRSRQLCPELGRPYYLGVMQRLVAVVRRLSGLREGESWNRVQIAVYAGLALLAIVLLIAWLTGTPLGCVAGGVCS